MKFRLTTGYVYRRSGWSDVYRSAAMCTKVNEALNKKHSGPVGATEGVRPVAHRVHYTEEGDREPRP